MQDPNNSLHPSFIFNELAEDRETYFNAIAAPIVQTSNFAFSKVADLKKAFDDEMGGYCTAAGSIQPLTSFVKSWQPWMARKIA